MHRSALLGSLLLCALAAGANAQSSTALSPNDSIFRRARRLVGEGNGVAGRAIVDSLLRNEAEGSVGYGNALYWRGALAETAADAERDYRRVIVEYSLSAYSDDALLAIAELEQARGDRAGALAHLQRFVKEHPVSPARGTAAFAAARLAFEQRDTRVGCAMITEARASAPSSNVELHNQIDYLGSRCSAADAAAAVANAPAASSAAPARDTVKKVVTERPSKNPPAVKSVSAAPSKAVKESPPHVTPPRTVATIVAKTETEPPTPAVIPEPVAAKPAASKPLPPPPVAAPVARARGIYTIQLAAYNTRPEAEALVAKLAAKGVKARVSGQAKPFRVRLEFYPTRQAATDEVAALKQRGIIGFVTTEESPPEGKTP